MESKRTFKRDEVWAVSTGTATTDGLVFGPRMPSDSTYISLYYHRHTSGGRPDKHKWHPSFLPPDEFELFDHAETHNWIDASGGLWGIVEELWRYAYAVYDRICKEVEPESTSDENRELMQSYFLGKHRWRS